MDATIETTGGDHHFATFSHSKVDPLEHLNNFGLDFYHVLSHLSNLQNIPPDALSNNSVSNRLEAAFDQFLHTDVLRLEYNDQSPGSVTVTGRSDLSHDAQHGGQLVFLSGYPSPGPSSRLTNMYNIKPEFWRRHIGFTSAASTSQFEDIKVPSAICDIFQLRIWTIGYRGNGARSDQTSVEALRKDSAKLMEEYQERLSTRGSFRTGDSVVRKYEVHDREFFSIEQLVTIYVSTAHENDKYEKNESWLGESFGRSRQVKANLLRSCCEFGLRQGPVRKPQRPLARRTSRLSCCVLYTLLACTRPSIKYGFLQYRSCSKVSTSQAKIWTQRSSTEPRWAAWSP